MEKRTMFLLAGVGVLLLGVIVAVFILVGNNQKAPEDKRGGIYMQEVNPENLPKPNLPIADVKASVNGKEVILENKCNSQVWKCTKNGCEEVCT